jgi:type 1 glutamine amidotransferase
MRLRLVPLTLATLTFAAAIAVACKDDVPVSPVADAATMDAAPAAGDADTADAADAADASACPRPPSTLATPKRPLKILFFTKETLFFHVAAHDAGNAAVPAYLRGRGHDVTVSDDPALFTSAGLAPFDVILFFVTSGSFLSQPQRDALAAFVRSGKGIAGVHSANATELDNAFFRDMIGASFAGHGVGDAQVIPASVIIDDPTSPLVSFLPSPWTWTDEYYYYAQNPAKNPSLKLLLSLDESSIASYAPDYPDAGFYGAEGHPLAWTQEYECARVFYTALGHTAEAYADDNFLRSIAVGTEWAGAPATEGP